MSMGLLGGTQDCFLCATQPPLILIVPYPVTPILWFQVVKLPSHEGCGIRNSFESTFQRIISDESDLKFIRDKKDSDPSTDFADPTDSGDPGLSNSLRSKKWVKKRLQQKTEVKVSL